MIALTRRRRFQAGFTLAEMLVAVGVFSVAFLGMWECIRGVFFLAAKNTGINLSHAALQQSADQIANQIRSSLQVVDVATFDGTTFTHINEAAAAGSSASGNAVRFLRAIPATLYVLPDDGQPYTETNPENPLTLTYPDYLTKGNTNVKVTCNVTAANLADKNFQLDLAGARLLPRFPYLTETITSGSSPGTLPGLTIATTPTLTSSPTTSTTLKLTYGLPAVTPLVPSCNQAYLVVVSAAAVLNRGTQYAELVYYPDASNLSRKQSLSTALSVSASGSGPAVFALPISAGALSDPDARASLQINLPVLAPNLGNAVSRNGNTAGVINASISLPVEVRRRAKL